MTRPSWRGLVAAVAAATWAVLYGWPLVAVASRSIGGVAGRPGLSLSAVADVLTDGRIGRLALVGLGQTVLSTALVVAIGVPVGWVTGRLAFGGRRVVAAVVMTPFVLPTLTVAAAMIAIVGGLPGSGVARFAMIVAAHVTFNLGLMVRSVRAAVAAVPPSLEQAAVTLGRGPVRAAAETLAAVKPAIASAALLVALFCLTSFGVVVALGGASVGTIEVEVWYLSTRALDLAPAAVLAAAQLVVVLAVVVAYQRLRPTRGALVRHPLRRPSPGTERRAVVAAVAVTGVVSGLPLVALALRSFRSGPDWTLANYRGLFGSVRSGTRSASLLASGDAWRAVGYSLAGAAVATVVALVVAVPVVAVARRPDRVGRWFERAMVVPLAVSAATLGLGFLLAFGGPVVDLRGRWIAVPLVQAAAASPVVVLILLAAVRALDPAPIEAAAVAGAGPARRLRTVVWPALRRPVLVAAGFAFAMSVGEFGATVFLVRQDRPTVPVLIGRLVGRPGSANLGQALALSCVLGVIAAVSVVVADRSSESPTF